MFQLYTYLHYLHLLPNPASAQPYHDPALRYEVRMRPFLTLQDGFIDMYGDWLNAINPFGDFDKPNGDFKAKALGLCDIAEAAMREARSGFSHLKLIGASAACAEKVEKSWMAVRTLSQADQYRVDVKISGRFRLRRFCRRNWPRGIKLTLCC